MIRDAYLVFDPAATAITVTAVSTNVLDMGVARDMGIGRIQGKILALVGTQFTSGTATATMNVQLQGAPDSGAGVPGVYQTIVESGTIPLGQLSANTKIAQFDIGVLAEGVQASVTSTATYSAASTAVTVPSTTPTTYNGMQVVGVGIVPGTTIATGGGTTSLVLSTNTTAASTTGPLGISTLTFLGAYAIPRFYRLNYVCSNTMTAGTLQAWIGLDVEEMVYYRPGVVVPV
jgi:hypothetical protein